MKYHLFPNPNHSEQIKAKQRIQISKILGLLKEKDHPSYSNMQEMYDRAMEILESQETQIFPSFYKLVEFLQKEEIPHTLVIRTFGSEFSEIAEELNEHFGDEFISEVLILKQGTLQGSSSDLYQVVANPDRHLIIRDDWEWWAHHGRRWEYGKPFPVDLNDSQRISLFFDDNAGIDPLSPHENIVAPYDAVNRNGISPQELIEKGRLFPVEMIEALCDEDYYIRSVQKALCSQEMR